VKLIDHLRTCARANRLANRRLHGAMASLLPADFHAPRTGFFPSLAATANHILAVDIYYLAALLREADMEAQYLRFVACADAGELSARQRACDEKLIAHVDALSEAALDAEIVMDRGDWQQVDRCGHVLAHLFMHQTHHRGQIHAMLSGTAAAPPQLDEFLMPSDAPLRAADLQALGWREADLFGGPADISGYPPQPCP
jgi:uncharacterized damage-inducible protein DinB